MRHLIVAGISAYPFYSKLLKRDFSFNQHGLLKHTYRAFPWKYDDITC